MLRPMSALPPKANIRADEIDVRFVPLPNTVRCSNLQRFIEDLVGQAKLLSKGEARRIAANIAKGGLIFALAGLLLLLRGRRFHRVGFIEISDRSNSRPICVASLPTLPRRNCQGEQVSRIGSECCRRLSQATPDTLAASRHSGLSKASGNQCHRSGNESFK